MKLEYLKLQNFAFINAGMRIPEIELDFRKTTNTINLIIGNNGTGKTGLLSNIHPFATLGHIDARDDSDLIIPGETGYKKCIYSTKKHEYEIEHFYKPSGDSRIISSYIKKDGKELNPPGTVRSFLSIVQNEFDIDINFLKLIRLGGNVTNFVELNSAGRIQFIGKMLAAVVKYLKANKIMRARANALNANLKNAVEKLEKLNISDISLYHASVEKKIEALCELQKERDNVLAEYYTYTGKMGKEEYKTFESDMKNLDDEISELKDKKKKLEKPRKIHIIADDGDMISYYRKCADDVLKKRTECAGKMSEIAVAEGKLEVKKKELLDRQDGLLSRIEYQTMEENLNRYMDKIKEYEESHPVPLKITMDDLKRNLDMINLIYFQLNDIYQLGDTGYFLNLYSKFDKDLNAIDEYTRDRAIVLRKELDEVKSSGKFSMKRDLIMFIPDKCTEYKKCPYYAVFENKDDIDPDSKINILESELRSIETIPGILTSIYHIRKYCTMLDPNIEATRLDESNVIESIRFKDNGRLIDVDKVNDLKNEISLRDEYLEYCESYKNASVDFQLATQKESLTKEDVEDDIAKLDEDISKLDDEHTKYRKLVSAYNDEYHEFMDAIDDYNTKMKYDLDCITIDKRLEDIDKEYNKLNKIAEEAKSFFSVSKEYDSKIDFINYRIDEMNNEIDDCKLKEKLFNELTDEIKRIKERYDYVLDIRDATSQSEGIPLIHIKLYCRALCTVANQIIKEIYTGDFRLKSFDVDDNNFKIPYITKGIKVKDIRNGSQAEVSVAKLAISFAMLSQFMTKYNIPLFDEVDGPLHQVNKERFFSSIEGILSDILHCEQAFMITQSSMYNDYPVNFIVTDPEYRNMIPKDACVVFQR